MFSQIETLVIDKLLVYGPLGAIALFVFLAVRKYGPMLVDAHLGFVTKTSNTLDQIANSSERQAESTEQLTQLGKQTADTLQHLCKINEQHHDPKGVPTYEKHIFSTVDTNKALRLLCQAKLLETTNEPARALIDEAIRVLTPK